ncbi:MAG: fuconate dehydratase [Proteobacteria bacterium SG_bin6]|nr:MAG: fuconate dehydratase [Proteobacteria bacterium SG_bin6]
MEDLRFPTSATLAGSDAMNRAPDYSAAYVVLRTDTSVEGHGFTFTIGRGNELCVAAIEALRPMVVGQDLGAVTGEMSRFWRSLAGDSQLRWTGPEKGVVHLALAAVMNAIWDLWARAEGKPVWRLVADMTPAQIVSLIDFRHIIDALSPTEAEAMLAAHLPGRRERIAMLADRGYPAYTTSAGWLGYTDTEIRRLCQTGVAEGWDAFKIKVGADAADDARRCAIMRAEIGPDRRLMIDANQVWEIDQAIERTTALSVYDPWWIEEPVSPDDILGHARVARAVRPIRVATGEQAANRVIFKQLLQADAIDVVQLDNCRLGGLNEVLAVLLLAAKFGKPVCPHAGGVGLCEYAQHVSAIDYICISGSLDGRMTEYAGHLHEHFVDPVRIERGRYRLTSAPGFSAEILPASRARYRFTIADSAPMKTASGTILG